MELRDRVQCFIDSHLRYIYQQNQMLEYIESIPVERENGCRRFIDTLKGYGNIETNIIWGSGLDHKKRGLSFYFDMSAATLQCYSDCRNSHQKTTVNIQAFILELKRQLQMLQIHRTLVQMEQEEKEDFRRLNLRKKEMNNLRSQLFSLEN